LNSGLIESRVKEGRTVIPSILSEVRTISSEDNLTEFDEFYQIPEDIQIQKKREKITLKGGNILVRVPFSNELQDRTGIFLFYLNLQEMRKKRTRRRKTQTSKTKTIQIRTGIGKKDKRFEKEFDEKRVNINFNLSGSSIHRIPLQDWDNLQSELVPITKHDFVYQTGYKNAEEFDKNISKAIQKTVQVQEQIRSRIKGVPALSFDTTKFGSVIDRNSIKIPEKLLEKIKLQDDEKIELIEGKGEYLFYVRRIPKRKDPEK
jgi:hypothetical protein